MIADCGFQSAIRNFTMNVHESITQSLDNLTKRKLRSLLTMLGIIFGVGAVISMLSIGAGAEDQALGPAVDKTNGPAQHHRGRERVRS